MARAIVAGVALGLLRELAGGRPQDLEEALGRRRRRFARSDLRDAMGDLIPEEGAVGAVVGSLRAGQPAEIIGLRLRQEGGRKYRRRIVRGQAITGDPLGADAGVLDERDSCLFIARRSLADVPTHQRLAERSGQRDPGAAAIRVSVNQPHDPVSGDPMQP